MFVLEQRVNVKLVKKGANSHLPHHRHATHLRDVITTNASGVQVLDSTHVVRCVTALGAVQGLAVIATLM